MVNCCPKTAEYALLFGYLEKTWLLNAIKSTRMKHLAILFFGITCLSVNLYSQGKFSEVGALELKYELLDSINHLKRDLEKTKKDYSFQKNILTEQIKEAASKLGFLNSVVDTYGNILTILGIFIAIIALFVPLAAYLFAIKPSREILKDLEKNFDIRLETYLYESRNKQIKKAFESIKNGDPEHKHQAVAYLNFTQNEGLTDNQLFQIYTIIKNTDTEDSIRSQLAFILTSKKSDYASEIFNSEEYTNSPSLQQMAYIYYGKIGYAENLTGIKILLSDKITQYENFTNLMLTVNQYNPGSTEQLLNDSKVLNLLGNETLLTASTELETLLNSSNINANYKSSQLFERIKKLEN